MPRTPLGSGAAWSRSAPALALASSLALALAVYASVLDHRFLLNWDDLTYVVQNPLVRGLTWENVSGAFGRFYFGNYAPLHLVSYAVDFSLWGLEPRGFLLTNVLLHGVNGWLLFLLLSRLGMSSRGSAVAAVVFVVHPVQVESVAWVSERKNLLAMAFTLSAWHAFVGYRAKEARGRWIRYAAALLGTAAALLSKAIAVVIAPLLLLFDLCYVPPANRRHWVADKIPLVVMVLGLVALTLLSQREAIAEGQAVFELTGWAVIFTMVPVIGLYLGMVFWPANLSAMYTPAVRHGADATFWASTGLLLALAVVGALLWRRWKQAFFWYALFFVGLVPVLHVVPLPTLMNDRYLYFPMMGVAGLCGLATDAAASWQRTARYAALGVTAACAIALAVAASARAEVWRDDVSLWRDAAEKTPRASLAWIGLGMSLLDAGQPLEAIAAYQRAIAVDPFNPMALNNLGAAYNEAKRPEEGRPVLLRAVQLEPGYFEAHMNLGIGYRMSGDLVGARRAFTAAISLRPQSADARSALDAVSRASRE